MGFKRFLFKFRSCDLDITWHLPSAFQRNETQMKRKAGDASEKFPGGDSVKHVHTLTCGPVPSADCAKVAKSEKGKVAAKFLGIQEAS